MTDCTTKRPRLLSYMAAVMSISTSLAKSNALNAVRSTSVVSIIDLSYSLPELMIGTHDGTFHCDEALAIGMLKCLPKYASSTVLRTRKPDPLNFCSIVVDVGATYDPANHRYDHHQRGFMHTFDGYTTKLSSAGLVYKHFGREILHEVAKTVTSDEADQRILVDVSYEKIYKDFMEHIDAIDNGISVCDSAPKYHISSTLSNRVGALNPAWNEESSAEIINARFVEAMALTCSEFLQEVESLMKVWWPARSIVQQAVKKRYSIHESGKIVIMGQYCPWKDHIFDIEKEVCGCYPLCLVIFPFTWKSHYVLVYVIQESVTNPILYALYEDSGGSWRIQVRYLR
jgi:uncharacterized UPF0160 family protein